MRAWLMKLGYWGLVSCVVTIPPPVEDIERREWLKMQSKAAGEIYLAVAPDQRMHLSGIEEDPVKMWTALQSAHVLKRPGARFNAYDALFSIRKKDGESLESLTTRIEC